MYLSLYKFTCVLVLYAYYVRVYVYIYICIYMVHPIYVCTILYIYMCVCVLVHVRLMNTFHQQSLHPLLPRLWSLAERPVDLR